MRAVIVGKAPGLTQFLFCTDTPTIRLPVPPDGILAVVRHPSGPFLQLTTVVMELTLRGSNQTSIGPHSLPLRLRPTS